MGGERSFDELCLDDARAKELARVLGLTVPVARVCIEATATAPWIVRLELRPSAETFRAVIGAMLASDPPGSAP